MKRLAWTICKLMALPIVHGCTSGDEVVAIEPRLACAEVVVCHTIAWRLGVRFGPSLSGTHVVCRCEE